jgi:hypothetical protein
MKEIQVMQCPKIWDKNCPKSWDSGTEVKNWFTICCKIFLKILGQNGTAKLFNISEDIAF